jgi:hypothetical protein
VDWTTNPLIALYFACENDDSDGKWLAMDAYQMITKAEGNVEIGIGTIRTNSFERMIQLISGWTDDVPQLPTKTFPLSPEHSHRTPTISPKEHNGTDAGSHVNLGSTSFV